MINTESVKKTYQVAKQNPVKTMALGLLAVAITWVCAWVWQTQDSIRRMEITIQAQWQTVQRMEDIARQIQVSQMVQERFQSLILTPAILSGDVDMKIMDHMAKHLEGNLPVNEPVQQVQKPLPEYIEQKEYQHIQNQAQQQQRK